MPPDPFRRRGRSRTPHRHRARTSSVETIRNIPQDEERPAKPLRRYGHQREAGSVTCFRNSSGPQPLPDSVPREEGNAQDQQELLGRLARAVSERNNSNKKVEHLLEKADRLREENRQLCEDTTALRNTLHGYRQVMDDKSSECTDLKRQLEEMGQTTASHNRGSSWSFSNLLPGTRESHKPESSIVNELRNNLDECKRKIQDLEAENRNLQHRTTEQAKHLQTQSTKFAQELDDLRSKTVVKGAKVSDTEIQSKWKTLSFSIRQFVSSHFPAVVELQTILLLAHNETFKWIPEMALTLQTPMVCHMALESWIWHYLCFRVFDSHSDFWAGEIGKKFGDQCDQMRGLLATAHSRPTPTADAVAQFHEWRVRTVDFISKIREKDEASSITLLAEQMISSLGPIHSPKFLHGHADPGMRQDLLEIIQTAAQLAGMFRASKADFHVFITRVKLPLVDPPSFGFPFDPETMERVKNLPTRSSGNVTSVVDLAVSPGIFKAGNSDGANYDSEHVLVKLQALCDLRATRKWFGIDGEQQEKSGKQTPQIQAVHGSIKHEEQCLESDTEMAEIKVKPED